MSAQPIPEAWRRAVCEHLRARGRRIEATKDFFAHWQRDFPQETYLGLLHDFEHMLSSPLQGCPILLGPPARQGDTWEFWFMHGDEKAYGKILLRKDGKGIVLYSAHLPERRYLDCERTN
jgi:hypothetical protein